MDVGAGVVGQRCPFKMDDVIEHVDIALRDWFKEALDVAAVELGPSGQDEGSTRRKPSAATLHLQLVGITEQLDRRNNAVSDLRNDEGRVVGRQGAARVFDLDYVCEVAGDPIDAHSVLGRLLQLLIGHDTIPIDYVPTDIVSTEMTMADIPIEIELAPPDAAASTRRQESGAGVAIRATLPIWPIVDTQIGEPAVHLHLDVGPEPGSDERSDVTGGDATVRPRAPIDRKWTTVRRREFIAPGSVAPKGS